MSWGDIVQWFQSHTHREKQELSQVRDRVLAEHAEHLAEIQRIDRKRREQEAQLRSLEIEGQIQRREEMS